jgi:hypothetical protein
MGLYTVVVADYIIEIQRGIMLVAFFVAQGSLEDVVILKLNVGGRLVEAHNVNL